MASSPKALVMVIMRYFIIAFEPLVSTVAGKMKVPFIGAKSIHVFRVQFGTAIELSLQLGIAGRD